MLTPACDQSLAVEPGPPHVEWPDLADNPCASFQWKGTTLHLSFTCPECKTACDVNGADFAYNVACPKCGTGYSVDHYVPCERIAGGPRNAP